MKRSRNQVRRLYAHKAVFTVMLVGAISFWPMTASAESVVEIQALDFGKWAVTNNNAFRYVTVQPNGSYSNSPQLIMLLPPQPGIYKITGVTPFAAVSSITVTMIQPMQGGNQDFTTDNFQEVHTNANGAGEVNMTLGATAKTNASGQGYDDGVYSGVLSLEVNL